MSPSDLILTVDDFHPDGYLRALRKLEHEHAPKLRKAAPYWRPKPPACWRTIHEPEWNWTSQARGMEDFQDLTVLDCNGAFLAPLSGTYVAHGVLERTGPVGELTARQVLPGYYRINAAPWGASEAIVSPLGQGSLPPQVWVAAPTLTLLLELQEEGVWPGVRVYDSWTCDAKVRPTKWAAWLRDVRLLAMDTDAQTRLEFPDAVPTAARAVKDGYAMAFQLMIQEAKPDEPRKSGVFRPDWYHTVRAQHKANMWRKAWKCLQAGIIVTYMGKTDEIELPTAVIGHLIDMPEPPIRIDLTGRALGAFKIKDEADE